MRAALAVLALVTSVSAAWTVATPDDPRASASGWTILSGPTPGLVHFEEHEVPALSIQGRIDAPLSADVLGGITRVQLLDGGSSEVGRIEQPAVSGGANGASFTVQIERSALPADCKTVKVTYTLEEGGTVDVSFANPTHGRTAVIDLAYDWLSHEEARDFAVRVLDQKGELDKGFTGDVHVSASSLAGSRVLLNGSFGAALVEIEDGVGKLHLEGVRGLEHDSLIFDLTGARLDPARSALRVL